MVNKTNTELYIYSHNMKLYYTGMLYSYADSVLMYFTYDYMIVLYDT